MLSALVVAFLSPSQLDAVQTAVRKIGVVEFACEGEYLRLDRGHNSRVNAPYFKFNGTIKIRAPAPLVLLDHRKPHGDDIMESRASYTPKRGTYTYKLASKKTPLGSETDAGGFAATTHLG